MSSMFDDRLDLFCEGFQDGISQSGVVSLHLSLYFNAPFVYPVVLYFSHYFSDVYLVLGTVVRFFIGGSYLFQLSSGNHGCRLIFGLPSTSLAVSRISVPIELTGLLMSGSKKLKAANRPPIVALRCVAMFGSCSFSVSNLTQWFLFFRFFCNFRFIIIITRSVSGKVLVFGLLMLDLSR